jgi:hypothetical protein
MSPPDRNAGVAPHTEVVLAHDANAGPLTAVRNIVIQSSIAQLKAKGHYERYCDFIEAEVREDLVSRIAPSWIPLELAVAHYEACDNLNLTLDELNALGTAVGAQVSDVALVSRAKKVQDRILATSTVLSQLHRMWPRVYQGGSVQVLLVASKDLLIEQRGLVLNRIRYFRMTQMKTITVAHESAGLLLDSVKIDRYSPVRDEILYRLTIRSLSP